MRDTGGRAIPPWRGRTRSRPRGRGLRLRERRRDTQAADSGMSLVRARVGAPDWPFEETGRSLKELFPAGIIARGIGDRSGLLWRCLDSSHAQSRGS